MLRYVKFNPTTQLVYSFCCGRVIFSDVAIELYDISLLFDNNYIEKTFKKYVRKKGEWTEILASNCGKCEGYGFYDWVTRLTDSGDKEPVWNRGGQTKPLIVKNENPISVIYRATHNNHTFYYISDFKADELTYRCEECLGTGIPLHEEYEMIPLTIDSLPKPRVSEIIKPKTYNIFRRIYGTIFHHRNSRQAVQ